MKKILIIHGPNMNLIGIKSKENGQTITLGKINTAIKNLASENNIKLKILQTHSQSKANKFLHVNRNIALGVLLCPQSWNDFGFTIKESIEILNMPYKTIQFNNNNSIFSEIIINNNPIKAYLSALKELIKTI